MRIPSRAEVNLLIGTFLCLGLGSSGYTQSRSPNAAPVQKGPDMMVHATGTFEVKLVPQGADDKAEGSTLARLSIEKHFHGDLEATAIGHMLTAVTDVKGSAGYVAIERVNGKLNGRSGTFVFQHSSTLTRGAPHQSVTVVPDSGTGQLTGITGSIIVIIAADGKHSYEFDYSLPETP